MVNQSMLSDILIDVNSHQMPDKIKVKKKVVCVTRGGHCNHMACLWNDLCTFLKANVAPRGNSMLNLAPQIRIDGNFRFLGLQAT